MNELVTKEYLDMRLAEFKTGVKSDINSLENSMSCWTIGIVGVAQGLALALLRLT